MFTGIVACLGRVQSLENGRLSVFVPDAWPDEPWAVGESVAIEGCCLTVASFQDGLEFDLSPETLARTTLRGVQPGSRVNVERAMMATDRFGGHFVQGHIDTVGRLLERADSGEWRFTVDAQYDRYLIDKGSVTLDGVSLTVIRPSGGEFTVALVPHTIASTTLQDLSEGDQVNVEFDVLAKHVEKLTVNRR